MENENEIAAATAELESSSEIIPRAETRIEHNKKVVLYQFFGPNRNERKVKTGKEVLCERLTYGCMLVGITIVFGVLCFFRYIVKVVLENKPTPRAPR